MDIGRLYNRASRAVLEVLSKSAQLLLGCPLVNFNFCLSYYLFKCSALKILDNKFSMKRVVTVSWPCWI